MPETAEMQIGGRIRRLRRQRRLNQADLATALGISPSYLNLIEHNRRKLTVDLLFRISGYFGVEPGELADADETRLVGDLMEAFGDDLFADSDLTNQEIRDLAHTNPGAARAVLRLYDKYRAVESGKTGVGLDASDEAPGVFHLATDAISDFLQERGNYFPELEAAAERVRADIDNAADSFDAGLRAYLGNVFGMDLRLASLPHGIARRLDLERSQLLISETLSRESAQFAAAHQLGLMGAVSEIDAVVRSASLPEGDAPALARNVLASYFAAAVAMPYERFYRACRDYRYDIERLSRRFGTSFEQTCHRMTTLQRPGMQGIPLHLVRTDIAGNISKRFSLSGIHIPRHSGACPRWNVYSAFLSPDRINIQISEMPDGQRYFCIARAVSKGDNRHHAQRSYLSIGLGCSVVHAREMIYSDGLDLANPAQIVQIGVGCRICPRLECGQRAHPPADHRFRLDDTVRPESIYARI
ncbi:MAG TPA: short-chain fatty acyl-CoA regulator family protein [Devosiaceae bacterium]